MYRAVPLGLSASSGSRPSLNRGDGYWDELYSTGFFLISHIHWPAIEQLRNSSLFYGFEDPVVIQANLFYRMTIVGQYESATHFEKRLHLC